MPSLVIDRVNHIIINEGQTPLIKFYDRKGNPVGYDDTKITGLYGVPNIIWVDEENFEEPQDKYNTTDVDIEKDYQQDEQQY